ncbi:MAG: hypothetical protein V5A88_09580, partial [Candidatus Thermoplasmatota archaeon]
DGSFLLLTHDFFTVALFNKFMDYPIEKIDSIDPYRAGKVLLLVRRTQMSAVSVSIGQSLLVA